MTECSASGACTVQTLNLYVKDGVHVDFDAVVRLDIICQTLLVVALDLAQLVEQLLVVRIVVQNLQLGRMGAVAGADLALDQLSQPGLASHSQRRCAMPLVTLQNLEE